jgi:hypothetical protein
MSEKPQLEIINVPITEIIPYWRNPRNNEAAVQVVKASIERFGFTQPIILDTEKTIIAGHTRYMAAKQLGLATLPCVISLMDEAKAKEYRVIDNKSSEAATWDTDKLMAEIREWQTPAEVQAMMPDFNIAEFLNKVSTPAPVPTNEKIAALGQQMQAGVAQIGSATRNLVDMSCPGCGNVFQVDRDEVARRSFYVPVAKPPEPEVAEPVPVKQKKPAKKKGK